MSRNPNRMQEATDMLMSKFQMVASVLVTITMGATTINNVKATPGRSPFQIIDNGVLVAFESRHYIIAKSDLQGLVPTNGMKITESDGRVYEVGIPKPLNCYENFGPGGTALKIHTKAVA